MTSLEAAFELVDMMRQHGYATTLVIEPAKDDNHISTISCVVKNEDGDVCSTLMGDSRTDSMASVILRAIFYAMRKAAK